MGDVQLGPITHLSPSEVMALWVDNGGDRSKAAIAAAIVFSSENPEGNAGLVNNTPSTGDYSVGLWQINYAGSLLGTRSAQFGSPQDLADNPALQARAAIAMSSNGQNWGPWGPDLGYEGYGQDVAEPTSDSRVGRWLAAHGLQAPAATSMRTVGIAAAILGVAGAAAWWISNRGLRMPRGYDFAFGNPARGAAEDSDPSPMYVQSLLFPRSTYNVPMAKSWARSHGYKSGSVDVTAQYIHLVQADPAMFSVIRTIPLGGKGIKAHVARE